MPTTTGPTSSSPAMTRVAAAAAADICGRRRRHGLALSASAALRASVAPVAAAPRVSAVLSTTTTPTLRCHAQPFLPSVAAHSARLLAARTFATGGDGPRNALGSGVLGSSGWSWQHGRADDEWDDYERAGRGGVVEGEDAKPPESEADLVEGWLVDDINVDVSIDIDEDELALQSVTAAARASPLSIRARLAALSASGELEELAKVVDCDAGALLMYLGQYGGELPAFSGGARGIAEWELSVVLIDDEGIRTLNRQHRGVDKATDVLSFPLLPDPSIRSAINVWLLGDVFISVETAMRQADERDTSLLDELRVLLVHGVLHIVGYDHEASHAAGVMMGEKEWEVMQFMGWKGRGLIELAGSFDKAHDPRAVARAAEVRRAAESASRGGGYTAESMEEEEEEEEEEARTKRGAPHEIKLVALDLDGTLLDSTQSVSPVTAEAIRLAMAQGVRFVAATGKARPAALAVLSRAGLATAADGEAAGTNAAGGMIGLKSPGIFLQGLAVYDATGTLLPGSSLDPDVVVDAFMYSLEADVALVGFCGDTTITMRKHALIDELHHKYSEPKAQVLDGIDDLFAAPPVLKLIFLHESPAYIRDTLRPLWQSKVDGRGADLVQAIDHMLEIVPRGVNKAQALRRVVDTLDPPVAMENVMAVGDGENDVEMLKAAGVGVAMGNASVLAVDAASYIVSDNNHDGVADAVRRFVLNSQ